MNCGGIDASFDLYNIFSIHSGVTSVISADICVAGHLIVLPKTVFYSFLMDYVLSRNTRVLQ